MFVTELQHKRSCFFGMEIESAQIKSHNGSWLKLMSLVLIPPHKKGGRSLKSIKKKKKFEVVLSYVSWIEYLVSGGERKNFCHET